MGTTTVFSAIFVLFFARSLNSMALWRKTLFSNCNMCKRQTKYSCITCGKSVCVRYQCSVAENNEDTVGWEENKSVGYCMSCAEPEGRKDSGRSNTDEEENNSTNSTKSDDDDESDSGEDIKKASSEEGKKKRQKLGRKAAWKESQVTDMVNVICNDEILVRKLIFTNVKKSSNTDAYEKVILQLGNDFPFTVKQMRTKFKWCISVCKKVCLTIKTASGINNFIEDKGYGSWFNLLYPLVKSRDSCQPERACEPSAHCSKDGVDCDDDDCGSTSSSVTEKLPQKSKSLPIKKPKSKKGKTDHVSKVLELVQTTIDNDPTKELLQFLKEDIKQSREQERMYFQMMCGFMNSNVYGNPHYYQNLQSDSIHSLDAQSIPSSMPHRSNSTPYAPTLSSDSESVSATTPYSDCNRPYSLPLPSRDINVSASMRHRVSTQLYTPPPSYAAPASTVSTDGVHPTFMSHIQSSLEIPKYHELKPCTPTYKYEESLS